MKGHLGRQRVCVPDHVGRVSGCGSVGGTTYLHACELWRERRGQCVFSRSRCRYLPMLVAWQTRERERERERESVWIASDV